MLDAVIRSSVGEGFTVRIFVQNMTKLANAMCSVTPVRIEVRSFDCGKLCVALHYGAPN